MWDYELPKAPLIPSKLLIGDCRVSSRRSFRKEPTSYLHELDPAYYNAYDRGFIIENRKEDTLDDEHMQANVQVMEYRQLPDIEANDVNNSLIDSMNQELQTEDYESYANEVHSEGMLILDSNVDTFTEEPNEEDVQPLIQVNEESMIIANNSFLIPMNIQWTFKKSERMQRKFKDGPCSRYTC